MSIQIFSYVFKKKYFLKNENLEEFLFIIYIELEELYEIKLNFRQKRFIREETIKYFLQTGRLNKSHIINAFKQNYVNEENKEKIINTNEDIINKILIINNINNESNNESDNKINNQELNEEIKLNKNEDGEIILCNKSEKSNESIENESVENESAESFINEENKSYLSNVIKRLREKRKIINKYNYNIKYIKNFNVYKK